MLISQQAGIDTSAVVEIRERLYQVLAARKAAGVRLSRTVGEYYRNPRNDDEVTFFTALMRLFWGGPLPNAYRTAFDREPLLLIDLCKFRTQTADLPQHYVPWHLDANFYSFEVPLMTAWIPLVPVGVDAPGLEFGVPTGEVSEIEIRRYWEGLERRPEGGRSIETEDLEALLGPGVKRIAPPLEVGSCFIFDQYVPHRTQVLPTATKDRTALEFRVACANQGPGRLLLEHAEKTLGARYDRVTEVLKILPLTRLFPAEAGGQSAGR